jgi:hypothetical protein
MKKSIGALAVVISLLGIGTWAGLSAGHNVAKPSATATFNCCDDPSCPPGCNPDCPPDCCPTCPPCPICQ